MTYTEKQILTAWKANAQGMDVKTFAAQNGYNVPTAEALYRISRERYEQEPTSEAERIAADICRLQPKHTLVDSLPSNWRAYACRPIWGNGV